MGRLIQFHHFQLIIDVKMPPFRTFIRLKISAISNKLPIPKLAPDFGKNML
jgi:hypothetical protein